MLLISTNQIMRFEYFSLPDLSDKDCLMTAANGEHDYRLGGALRDLLHMLQPTNYYLAEDFYRSSERKVFVTHNSGKMASRILTKNVVDPERTLTTQRAALESALALVADLESKQVTGDELEAAAIRVKQHQSNVSSLSAAREATKERVKFDFVYETGTYTSGPNRQSDSSPTVVSHHGVDLDAMIEIMTTVNSLLQAQAASKLANKALIEPKAVYTYQGVHINSLTLTVDLGKSGKFVISVGNDKSQQDKFIHRLAHFPKLDDKKPKASDVAASPSSDDAAPKKPKSSKQLSFYVDPFGQYVMMMEAVVQSFQSHRTSIRNQLFDLIKTKDKVKVFKHDNLDQIVGRFFDQDRYEGIEGLDDIVKYRDNVLGSLREYRDSVLTIAPESARTKFITAYNNYVSKSALVPNVASTSVVLTVPNLMFRTAADPMDALVDPLAAPKKKAPVARKPKDDSSPAAPKKRAAKAAALCEEVEHEEETEEVEHEEVEHEDVSEPAAEDVPEPAAPAAEDVPEPAAEDVPEPAAPAEPKKKVLKRRVVA